MAESRAAKTAPKMTGGGAGDVQEIVIELH
jgi:hypothetical protein